MAVLDLDTLSDAITEDQPCGPDLSLEGDLEFLNYTARAEGLLPQSFFTFDRASIEFPKEFDSIRRLSAATHDLRLLTLNAKFAILNRDIAYFTANIEGIAKVLSEQWDAIHPQAEDGDLSFRAATVQSLEDMPHVILPLTIVPFVENRRYGVVHFRAWQIANGNLTAREDDTVLDGGTIERALLESELPEIIQRRDQFIRIADAAAAIGATALEKGGYSAEMSLDKLISLAREIAGVLDRHIASRDRALSLHGGGDEQEAPADLDQDGQFAQAASAGGGASSAMPIQIATRADAIAALRAAEVYFDTYEPSSPALLIVRYTQTLVGKPFFEVMRTLLPDFAARATLSVGQGAIRLDLGRLAERIGSDSDSSYSSGGDGDEASDQPAIVVGNRRDALKLLDIVSQFFRTTEPASPLPFLISRAREVSERDFTALMRDLFNDNQLRNIRGDDGY